MVTAQSLYENALQSIFVFLSLRELAFALRVSHDWMGAVGSMRRLDVAVEQPRAPLVAVAQSLMGRHVGALGWSSTVVDQSLIYRFFRLDENCEVKLDAADLTVLADRMAHLRELHCEPDLPPPTEPLIFPAQLRLLHVGMRVTDKAAQLNGAIAAIGRLPLLEELRITLRKLDPQLSFAPLATMPKLRKFNFDWMCDPCEFSDTQVDELRALTRLQKLDMPMTTALLRRLLRQPHDLQWQQISQPRWLDDEVAALLPQLPTLTTTVGLVECVRFEWLRGLPNLTDVHWTFEKADGRRHDGRAESLVAGLQSCANIKCLALTSCNDLTAAHLADLLPWLPHLRELTLGSIPIGSLSFLSQPPLTSQLSSLGLWSCRQLPPAELVHVHALRGLTQLELMESFGAPLDGHNRWLLTPPSAVLPLLKEFSYHAPDPPEPPAAEGDDEDGGDADGGGDGDEPADEADESDSDSDSSGDAAAAAAANDSDAEAE